MIIRPATHSDVERMDEICESAKTAMRNMGGKMATPTVRAGKLTLWTASLT